MTKQISWSLGVAVAILAGALALRYARNDGLIDAETAKRLVQVVLGLGLAAYANFIPKQIGRAKKSLQAAAWSQSALRVGGWTLTLAGLAYAALWAFAPLPFGDLAATVVLAGATLLTLGYAVWSFAACRTQRAGT